MIQIYKTEDGLIHQKDELSPGSWIALTNPTATEILEIANTYNIDPDDLGLPWMRRKAPVSRRRICTHSFW